MPINIAQCPKVKEYLKTQQQFYSFSVRCKSAINGMERLEAERLNKAKGKEYLDLVAKRVEKIGIEALNDSILLTIEKAAELLQWSATEKSLFINSLLELAGSNE